ncbi:hypothetical protein [Singulisphaera acidiphila]|uniref:hypothetical protein n=1 Tax=Singulisphaera acidiphila TaxID=466153 RepID=UPI0003749E42|nr:hypothetical protein [Singulisphaera acidiphila]
MSVHKINLLALKEECQSTRASPIQAWPTFHELDGEFTGGSRFERRTESTDADARKLVLVGQLTHEELDQGFRLYGRTAFKEMNDFRLHLFVRRRI